ncbi:MAG TPA: molybdopterin biosynthesis protein [Methanoregulaceae archaeon]|nr:molybdopterin biosynthesis protein [Methanoregulaceae archaeon]
MKRYLSLISFDRAIDILVSSFHNPERTETIPVAESTGRVIANPIFAGYSVPEENLSAMDGYAVKSRDTVNAHDQNPMLIEDFVQVNTGNIVPPGYDAVVMVEDTWETREGIMIRKPARPWQHIRSAGEDIRKNHLILPAGHVVRAFDIGALVTYGITKLDVRTVNIGLVPTGSEIVPMGSRPGPGQVVESNTVMAQVYLRSAGAQCIRYSIVPDAPDLIRESLENALKENDLVLISAGSSAGMYDYTADVISSMGDLLFHGVAVKPGKSVMLGNISGKPVLGLPGYPLAAQTVIREMAGRLLDTWGLALPPRYSVPARLAHSLVSDIGFDEFIPVSIGRVDGRYWGFPHSRGSGVQMAPVRANGFVHISSPVEGLDRGHVIDATLTTDPGSIDRTILISGRYDPAIGKLAEIIREKGQVLHAVKAGNTGGMIALNRHACHGAPVSLPDYCFIPNCQGISDLIPATGLIFIHIASLSQGIVSRDGISFDDLTRIRFINRQKGSSTRMIFDALLDVKGVDAETIDGYFHEVTSQEAVAEAIRDEFADAGICTSGVAKAAGLCFVPVINEQYELAVRTESFNDPMVRSLVMAIQSTSFRRFLESTGGYDISRTGTINAINNNLAVTEISRMPCQE